ncbi:uncharacterized protein tmem81 [Alosa alosa]|uniref:transmembrane protein 81 n=1 Tax=Alosa sapidissima TaxID=34773 RepID=UPI001C091E20|nr:transmembrane protein 81 [Alosa sapidissima]XP_048097944.1 uncharacterized protein tmem81 [Alosa alosa]
MTWFSSTLCTTTLGRCIRSLDTELNMWKLALWTGLLCGHLCGASPNRGDLEELESLSSMTVKHSSPCSTTCGLGIRVQELCPVSGGGQCYQRQVKCLDTWQCGMKTLTVPAGGRVELDCLGEVMGAMGRFAFIVSWRFARGIITTDSSLFSRLAVPQLSQLKLDPLQEQHAGTYCCDVLDKTHRRLKRTYYGLKVMPPELLRLDFTSALEKWDEVSVSTNGSQTSVLSSSGVKNPLMISLTVTAAVAVLLLLLFLWETYRNGPAGPMTRPTKQSGRQHGHITCKDFEEQIGPGPLSVIWDYLTRNGLSQTMVITDTENQTLL